MLMMHNSKDHPSKFHFSIYINNVHSLYDYNQH